METPDDVKSNLTNNNVINKDDFQFLCITGEGKFCKVWKAQHKKSHIYVAIKQISKLSICDKKYLDSIISEKNILSELHNNFIANMYSTFQDKENLYLIMDYHSGGDLRLYTMHHKKITEAQLKYIHSKGIIHRDIKPENVLCDEKGYFHICDFTLAKKIGNRLLVGKDISGTPGYIAPEAILQEVSSYEFDFFSLGVIIYEILFHKLPYNAKTKNEMKHEFHNKDITLYPHDIPKGFHRNELSDFVNRLLYIDRFRRLGSGGIHEIKNHPWLREFNWNGLKNKKMISDFIPKTGMLYARKLKENENMNSVKINKVNSSLLDDIVFQKQFEEYNTFKREIIEDNFKRLLTMRDTISITEKYLLAKRYSNLKNMEFKSTSPYKTRTLYTNTITINNENEISNRSISNEQKLLRLKLLSSSLKSRQPNLVINNSALTNNRSAIKQKLQKSSSTIENRILYKKGKHQYKGSVGTFKHVVRPLPKIVSPFSLSGLDENAKIKYKNSKSPENNISALKSKYIKKMMITTTSAVYDNGVINRKLKLMKQQKFFS